MQSPVDPVQPPEIPPSTVRNVGPILAVLRETLTKHLPAGGTILELASGTGHHACAFAAALPQFNWRPSEPEPARCAQLAVQVSSAGLSNLAPPMILDATASDWPAADAVLCINMIHIAPWHATIGLFTGAARALPEGGLVITYGPYLIDGDPQTESNRNFDLSLRARNPAWGLRDVAAIGTVADQNGFIFLSRRPMPANNYMLFFRKVAAPDR